MNTARATLTLHRKAKDGSDGSPGKDAVEFTITPQVVTVNCAADGTVPEGYSVDCIITLYQGGNSIISKYKPYLVNFAYCNAEISIDGTTLTLSKFSNTKSSGFVNIFVQVEGTTYKKKVTFTKCFDGEKGDAATAFNVNPQVLAIPCDKDGNPKLSSYSCNLEVLQGTVDVTSTCTMTLGTSLNCTAALSTDHKTLTLSNFEQNDGYTNVSATINTDGINRHITWYKVKDGDKGDKGDTGDAGKDSIIFNVNPLIVPVACDSAGNVKTDSTGKAKTYTCSVEVLKGGTNITSTSNVGITEVSKVTATLNSSYNLVTLSGFTSTEGYAIVEATVDKVNYARTIRYYKVYDGQAGTAGTDGHSYMIQCPPIIIYLNSAGKMKSSTQTVTPSLYIDGVKQSSGITWSVTVASGSWITATMSNGVITLTNYIAGHADTTALNITAKKSGMPDQTLRVPVGEIYDGAQGIQGVKSDTMLFQGEWQEGKTYKVHYELDIGSENYFTDYVTYGSTDSGMAVYYAALESSQGDVPYNESAQEYSTKWQKFTEADYIATKFLISNQILANLVEIVGTLSFKQAAGKDFFSETMKAKTIYCDNATFQNLNVLGYFKSGFSTVRYDYIDENISSEKGIYCVKNTLNIMAEKQSDDTGTELYIWLPNDAKYIGSRVLLYVAPNITDYGTGEFKEQGTFCSINTGCTWGDSSTRPTFIDTTDSQELLWFLNTKATASSSTRGLYLPARQIKVYGSYIEFIGTPYLIVKDVPTYCRWAVSSVQQGDGVEYLRDRISPPTTPTTT